VQRRDLNFCFLKETITGKEERVEGKSIWCSHRGQGGERGSVESNTEGAMRKVRRI